ncbi:MAG: hypothetical protein AAF679_03730 [Pseudomonadota bacterium]
MSMKAWNDAKTNLHSAREYLSKIGKQQRTTSDALGKWHSLAVNTEIHYQPTDGAKNYHECVAFDRAMSTVLKNHIHALQSEAMALLEAEVERTGKDARQSVQAMLDQIDAYESTP